MMAERRRVIVIVPAYNEEKTIAKVIEALRDEAGFADVVVVNDGSTDSTISVAQAAGVPVIDLPYNLGIGGAVQTGYKYAAEEGYDIAVQVDGDGQHPASEVRSLVEAVKDGGADLVIGSRYMKRSEYRTYNIRRLGSLIFSQVISRIIGQRVSDPTSGFRAASRRTIEFFSTYYPTDYPEPESIVLAHRRGLRVQEVPVTMQERQGGTSSITALRAMYYMIKVLLAIFIDVSKKINGEA